MFPEYYLSSDEMLELLQGSSWQAVLAPFAKLGQLAQEQLKELGIPVHFVDDPTGPFGVITMSKEEQKPSVYLNLAPYPQEMTTGSAADVRLTSLLGAVLWHEMTHGRRGHLGLQMRAEQMYPQQAELARQAAQLAGEITVRRLYEPMHAAFAIGMEEIGGPPTGLYDFAAIAKELGLPPEMRVGRDFETTLFHALMARQDLLQKLQTPPPPTRPQDGQEQEGAGGTGQPQPGAQPQTQQGRGQMPTPEDIDASEEAARHIHAITTYVVEKVLRENPELERLIEHRKREQMPGGREAGRTPGFTTFREPPPPNTKAWEVALATFLQETYRKRARGGERQITPTWRMSGAIIVPEQTPQVSLVEGRPYIRVSPQGQAMVPAVPDPKRSLHPIFRPPMLVVLDTSGSMWTEINQALATIASFSTQYRLPLIINAGDVVGAVARMERVQGLTAEGIQEALTKHGASWFGGTDLLAVMRPLVREVQALPQAPLGLVMITDTMTSPELPVSLVSQLRITPADVIIVNPTTSSMEWAKQWQQQGARLLHVGEKGGR